MSNAQERLRILRNAVGKCSQQNEAVNLAAEAVELLLECQRISSDITRKKTLTGHCKELLSCAESIKAANGKTLQPCLVNLQRTLSVVASLSGAHFELRDTISLASLENDTQKLSIAKSQASNSQKSILIKSSVLHGQIFKPWRTEPSSSDFQLESDNRLFTDDTAYRLSEHQRSILDRWDRPQFALPPPTWRKRLPTETHTVTMMMTGEPDFVQDAATDCSVVASLAAAVVASETKGAKLLSNVFYPFDHENCRPAVSANGKYIFRLNFNGCAREVVIDDRLPISTTERILHLVDRNNPTLLWPTLLEKAYLKVRGGYDFPGSNSGTDLWILFGWIPEQVLLQHIATDPEMLWQRMTKAFNFGDVIITIGTGKMTAQAERESGLAGEHDYAILDLKADEHGRFFLIKNPWLNASTWRDPRRGSGQVDDRSTGQTLSPGTFWMELSDVMQNFDSIFLNWNPALFTKRQDIHFVWDLLKHRGAPGLFVNNPQYLIEGSGDVWLVLSKHFISRGKERVLEEGFINLYAFDGTGHRVSLSRGAVKQGLYLDSPQTLLRLQLIRGVPLIVVVAEEKLLPQEQTFTLSAFSRSSVSMSVAPSRYLEPTIHDGAWTTETAGGNTSLERHDINPQFHLHLEQRSAIAITLETPESGFNVQFMVARSNGSRLTAITRHNVVVDSGEYRQGYAFAQKEVVDAGHYTVICSTFEPGQCGNFRLRVESTAVHSLKPIKRREAGRLPVHLPRAEFAPATRALAAPLLPRRIAKLEFMAKLSVADRASYGPARSASSPMSMSIESGRGPALQVLASCNNGAGQLREMRTGDLDLSPDTIGATELWLVLERLSGLESIARLTEFIDVQILADAQGAIEFGPWRVVDR